MRGAVNQEAVSICSVIFTKSFTLNSEFPFVISGLIEKNREYAKSRIAHRE